MQGCWEAGKELLSKAKPWAHCVDPGQVVLLCVARGIEQGIEYSMLEFALGFVAARARGAAIIASDVLS
eukprot:7993952-Pyramimonas_sp.AAC.1